MKSRWLPILLSFSLIFLFSCKKPETKKIPVQQTIETPVMEMAQQPSVPTPEELTAAKNVITPQHPDQAPPATPQSVQVVPTTQTTLKNSTNVEIIVDASGSMNSPIGTTTKINAVKSALRDIFSTPLPPDVTQRKVAIRSFGSKSTADKNDCNDTSLDLKMDKFNLEKFSKALNSITPQGISPVAFSLEESFKDFTESGDTSDNLAVLISDGWDSCNSDPLAAAERLKKGNSKVIIDVIGFDVDQSSQESLKKLAKSTDGHFFLARSDIELASALDQSISANLPYNLRVRVLSGATPLSSIITIYRANTQVVVERTEANGLKFFKLAPGSYDILVEYKESIEASKPSKMIKDVAVLTTSKAEQVVKFDLGSVNINAIDEKGNPTTANFYIRKSGSEEIWGRLMSVPSPQLAHLSPGLYDIDAETVDPGSATLTAQIKGIEVKLNETSDQTFKFQIGKLSLKAQNIAKQPIPIAYRITKPESQDVIASGEGTIDGVTVDLPPGNYDVYIIWKDPAIQGAPETKLSNLTLVGGEILEQLATIVTGIIKLAGKDSQNKFAHTEFTIKKSGTGEEISKAASDEVPVEVFVAPGTYDIVAVNTTSKVIPPPTVGWNNIAVKEGQTENLEAVFKLGSIKLIGKNAKEQVIATSFTVYRAGTDEPLVVENSERDWVTFSLTPGLYDIKAEDVNARSEPKPMIWFHDVELKEGSAITTEAIFTSGKLKLICRGKNNVILTCEFNIFSYGSDTALFSGATADEWREFDIPPGRYYMEAGWHDPVNEQFLKKWINIRIDENQIVEEVLRF